MLIEDSSKNFENPETGRFNGTIIDVVDLGKVKNSFGEEKIKVRIVWVLDKNDSEGNPFRVMRQVNATIADKPKKSNLYEIVEGVTGSAPAVPFNTDVLIGRSNELTIVRETDSKTGKVYANIKVILPLAAGAVPPSVPAGFVRAKDRKDRTATSAAPTVQPAATAQVNPAPVPAPQVGPAPVAQEPVPAGKVDAAF